MYSVFFYTKQWIPPCKSLFNYNAYFGTIEFFLSFLQNLCHFNQFNMKGHMPPPLGQPHNSQTPARLGLNRPQKAPNIVLNGKFVQLVQYVQFVVGIVWQGCFSDFLNRLEDTRSIGRFILALTEGPLGPVVKMVTDRVSWEGPSAPLLRKVMDRQGANGALIVIWKTTLVGQNVPTIILVLGNTL